MDVPAPCADRTGGRGRGGARTPAVRRGRPQRHPHEIATTAIFDFHRGRWSLGPPLHRPREHVAAVAAGGAIWLLGGRALGQGNFADSSDSARRPVLATHATDADRTEQLPGGLDPRTIVVVGGEGGRCDFGEVDALDPATGHWTRLDDLPTPRHGLGLVAYGSLVFAIEGGKQAGLTTSRIVEEFRMP